MCFFSQLFVVWSVDRTVYVSRHDVGVMKDGRVACVINWSVTWGVPNMASAKMEHVFVHKAGMEDIALCVSIYVMIL
jgi:hypothetical protein